MQFDSFVRQIPPVTLVTTGLIVLLSFIGYFITNEQGVVPFFAMLPGYTLPPTFFVWTLATSGFFETSLFNAIMNLGFFILFASYIERIWGSSELLKFILVVQILTNLLLLIIMVFLYGTTRSPIFLYGVDIHGMSAIMGGFLVVFKQLIPEYRVEYLSVRAKDGPLISVAVFLAFYIFGLTRFSELLCNLFGVYIAWVYLRFFQYQNGKKGDRSETFQFATFFPEKVRPFAVVVATVVFRALVAFKVCQRVGPEEQSHLPSFRASPLSSLLGGESSDAERRRAVASAALEARLTQPQHAQKSKAATASGGEVAVDIQMVSMNDLTKEDSETA